MESSSYQTAFVVWDIPSPHSNHSDVLLTTFFLHYPRLSQAPWISQAGGNCYSGAFWAGITWTSLLTNLRLSESACAPSVGCALLLQGLTVRIQLVLTKTFQRIMSVWKGLHYHTRCNVLGDQERWCFLSGFLEAVYSLKTASGMFAENKL